MLAIAAMAATKANTIATMTSGDRLAVLSFVVVTSVFRVPMSACIVPREVWIVATLPSTFVTVPVSVPREVCTVATLPSIFVTFVSSDASEVVIVPRLVLIVAVSPATTPSTASRLLRLVCIVPRLVCTVATLPLMLAMLPLRPETDDCIELMLAVKVPMEVLSVAVFPFMAINVALMLLRSKCRSLTDLLIANIVDDGSSVTVNPATAAGAVVPFS